MSCSPLKYEIKGLLTREQAEQIAELLGGGAILWADGHTYPADDIAIVPANCHCDKCHTSEEKR